MEICIGSKYVSHEGIVHEESKCPLCEALDKIGQLENELKIEREKLAEKSWELWKKSR